MNNKIQDKDFFFTIFYNAFPAPKKGIIASELLPLFLTFS